MDQKVKYERSIMSEMFIDGTEMIEASWRGARMDISFDEEEIFIMGCSSENEGSGEMQMLIDKVREDYPGREMRSSVPLNPVMEHILRKKGIPFPEGDE